jgi:integrase
MTQTDTDSKRLVFSKTRLEKLPMPTTGRVYYYDEKTPGLCLCVTANDSRTFYFYSKVHGRPVRYRLGGFPEMTVEKARDVTALARGAIAEGRDPQAERIKARSDITLGDLWKHWEEHTKQRKAEGSRKEDKRQYDKFLKRWEGRRLSAITKGEVQTMHARIGRDSGPYAANRALALLSAMYGRAISGLDWKGTNPCIGIERFPEQSRDRFLTPEEMPLFFNSLDQEEPAVSDYFRLAILTGVRKSNLLAMRWDQITMEGVWRIPATKSGDPVSVPLVPAAQEILLERKRLVGNLPWVFPGPGKSGHLVEVRKAWVRVCKRAGLGDLRIHDLRRTLGSWQAAAGASELIIGKTLGHRPGSKATAVYSRLMLDPVREAMDTATTAILAAAAKKDEKAAQQSEEQTPEKTEAG